MLTPTTRTLGILAAGLALVGCSTVRKADVLEARLRAQEDMLATYKSEMTRVKTELSVAHRETENLRLQLAETGQSTAPAEQTQAIARASGIQFSSLMTGGADIDARPGHDGLSVVLIPHDHDGELVKLPGSIEIEAFDLSLPGGAQRIGHWTFDQRDVHEYWHKGVIQSGYQFELPWQSPPQSDQVLVHGHLRTADGRKFDTTLTVKVDVPTGGVPASLDPGVKQASAEQMSHQGSGEFPVQHASAAGVGAAPSNDGIIWADGEGPPAGETPAGDMPATAASSVPVSRPAGDRNMAPPERALPFDVPPKIEDWWDADEWSTKKPPTAQSAVRTSDSFTDETIPRYR